MGTGNQIPRWKHEGFSCPEEAAEAFALQCQKEPQNPDVFFRMGTALEAAGEFDGAIRSFQHARRLCGDHAKATLAGCRLLLRFNRQAELRNWIKTSPLLQSHAEVQTIYAETCLNCGDYSECIAFLEKRPELLRNPRTAAVQIRAMVYDPAATAETLYNAATRWSSMHAAVEPLPAVVRVSDPDRRLRVGFVGTRMSLHNSSTHLLNLLRHTDSSQFETAIYSDTPFCDARTDELRAVADLWRDIHTMSAREAAEQIQVDEIDILVELHEFSNDARLQIFAYKPAPVQIHWLGNATTTGIAAIDWRITSRMTDPPEKDAFSAEKPLYVPCCYLYSPSPMAQDTKWNTATPAQKNGFITFGAIHHFTKYNPQFLSAWRQILEQLPGARLLIGRSDLQTTTGQAMIREHFKKNGIDPQRVDLEGNPEKIASLEIFNRIDIVLDSFPFNGDATTSDTLWMGVPLITLKGGRTASRRAADQLQLTGHPEWIAETESEYVEKAVTLARSSETLVAARKTLHAEFAASPICEHAGTASGIYAALRRAWQDGR
jgi:predicted O-linked N-acetylglucosamine transferase (SPINDLY family)